MNSKNAIMPWQPLIDDGWLIVGMNHYNLHGKRHLFCSMAKKGRCITAESENEQVVFERLKVQAKEGVDHE